MSITDELREWASIEVPYKYGHQLTAIADRIDAEHESACAEAYGNGVMSVPIALDESAWVKLPVDADGVPWHIGDVTENGVVVNAMELDSHGWIFLCQNDIDPSIHRHYHAPTVEDVLREFALAVCKDDALTIRKDVVEEYAKRLRLVNDEE